MNNAFEKPVAAIIEKAQVDQTARYTALVSELYHLAKAEDQNCFAMGDKFVQAEQEVGRQYMKELAKDAGIEWQVARQRHLVASRIPAGHPIRSMAMSYSHIRMLAFVENMDEWAQKVVENGWSVLQLKAQLAEAGVKKATEEGEPCSQCGKPLCQEDQTVSFSITGKKRELTCSIPCAVERLTLLKQAEPTADASLIESVNAEPVYSFD